MAPGAEGPELMPSARAGGVSSGCLAEPLNFLRELLQGSIYVKIKTTPPRAPQEDILQSEDLGLGVEIVRCRIQLGSDVA